MEFGKFILAGEDKKALTFLTMYSMMFWVMLFVVVSQCLSVKEKRREFILLQAVK